MENFLLLFGNSQIEKLQTFPIRRYIYDTSRNRLKSCKSYNNFIGNRLSSHAIRNFSKDKICSLISLA